MLDLNVHSVVVHKTCIYYEDLLFTKVLLYTLLLLPTAFNNI